jgi:aryl-phospho-beta-D-glucosidase BglC (GH1 family)
MPFGYWSIDVLPYAPYVQGAYPYLVRAVDWGRELSFGVLLDLRGVQNGQDNNGLQDESTYWFRKKTGVYTYHVHLGPVRVHTNQTNAERDAERTPNVLRNLTTGSTQPNTEEQ